MQPKGDQIVESSLLYDPMRYIGLNNARHSRQYEFRLKLENS